MKKAHGNQSLMIAIGLSIVALFLAVTAHGTAQFSALVAAVASTPIVISLAIEVLNYFVDGGAKLWGRAEGNYVTIILMVFLLLAFGILPQVSGYQLISGLSPLAGMLALLYILLPFELAIENTTLQKTVIIGGWFVLWAICYVTMYALGNPVTVRLTPFGI